MTDFDPEKLIQILRDDAQSTWDEYSTDEISHPFVHLYNPANPSPATANPMALYTAREGIQQAVQALAESGQVRVWLLSSYDFDVDTQVYLSLQGALSGACAMLCDEDVEDNADNPIRMDLVKYLMEDVQIKFHSPKSLRDSGMVPWDFVTIKDGVEVNWALRWAEAMP